MESKQSDNQEIQVFQSRGNIQMYPNPKKIKLTDYYKEKVSWQALSCNNLGQPINIHKQSTDTTNQSSTSVCHLNHLDHLGFCVIISRIFGIISIIVGLITISCDVQLTLHPTIPGARFP